MPGTAAIAETAATQRPAGPPLEPGSLRNLSNALQGLSGSWEAGVPVLPEPAALTRPQLRSFAILNRATPEGTLARFRQLRSRLLRRREEFEREGRRLQVLLVTSAAAGQGKTFVALNLGLMIAVAPGRRVLIVDANVEAPQYASRFDIPPGSGLREVIAGQDWRLAARKFPDLELFVLALGERRPGSMETLETPGLVRWLDHVRQDFDWILLDGPPLAESPDAEALAYASDGALLVLDPDRARARLVGKAMERLDPSRLAGIVFNRKPARTAVPADATPLSLA